eukprot:1980201-Alexandrium_andersonii.AAC.1
MGCISSPKLLGWWVGLGITSISLCGPACILRTPACPCSREWAGAPRYGWECVARKLSILWPTEV